MIWKNILGRFPQKQTIAEIVISMPSQAKLIAAIFFDALLCLFCVWLAYFLRIGHPTLVPSQFIASSISVITLLPIFLICGVYRMISRFASWATLKVIWQAIFFYGMTYAGIFTVISVEGVPRAVGLIQPLLLLIFCSVTRVSITRFLRKNTSHHSKFIEAPKVVIFGSTSDAIGLSNALSSDPSVQVCGFVTKDHTLFGRLLDGLPVFSIQHLMAKSKKNEIHYLIVPEADFSDLDESIIQHALDVGIEIKKAPKTYSFQSLNDLKELRIEDLLGRDQVPPDKKLLTETVRDKKVLVTGAGGSIGSEICKQIITNRPSELVMVDNSEFNLNQIWTELSDMSAGDDVKLSVHLVSINDTAFLELIFKKHRPDLIIHAAALKHVPMVERNVISAIRTNIFGTLNLTNLAKKYSVKNFVFISTDKAVRPTNVMGATKRFAEMILQVSSEKGGNTIYSMVRFGNVLGSSGSVVPRFEHQIRLGGPVTVTHLNITRYFMTISEAAQLVLQSVSMSRGGEVFLLEMGKPVKIFDLATKMIQLSGNFVKNEKNQNGNIEILVTGLRPGEKLHEELLIDYNASETEHPRIFQSKETCISSEDLEDAIAQLNKARVTSNVKDIIGILERTVSGYKPSSELQ